MARTYNESKCVFLAGPIEWWWDTPRDPGRFDSNDAQWYRKHRDAVRDFFVKRHYLVYSPHTAFKGDWNEKMQPVNDYVLGLSDIVVNLKPKHIPGLVCKGTDHEWKLAHDLGKVCIEIPPIVPDFEKWNWINYNQSFSESVFEMIIETERLKNGW